VIKSFAVLILVLISLATHSQNARIESDRARVVVMIDFAKGRQVISINGQATPVEKILFRLSEIRTSAPDSTRSVPAVVLAHERTSIYLISMKVSLMKAGFGPVRYFSYDENRSSMFEVTFSPPTPFNSSGPPAASSSGR
jgi:hypothetical protein